MDPSILAEPWRIRFWNILLSLFSNFFVCCWTEAEFDMMNDATIWLSFAFIDSNTWGSEGLG